VSIGGNWHLNRDQPAEAERRHREALALSRSSLTAAVLPRRPAFSPVAHAHLYARPTPARPGAPHHQCLLLGRCARVSGCGRRDRPRARPLSLLVPPRHQPVRLMPMWAHGAHVRAPAVPALRTRRVAINRYLLPRMTRAFAPDAAIKVSTMSPHPKRMFPVQQPGRAPSCHRAPHAGPRARTAGVSQRSAFRNGGPVIGEAPPSRRSAAIMA
jgi:hypothetical protein